MVIPLDVVFEDDEEPDFGPVDGFVAGVEALPEGEDLFFFEETACGQLGDFLIAELVELFFHPVFPGEQETHFGVVDDFGGEEADGIEQEFLAMN